MTRLYVIGGGVLLFLFLFIMVAVLLILWMERHERLARLAYRQRGRFRHLLEQRLQRMDKLYRPLADLLEALQIKLQPLAFLCLSGLLLLIGLAAGGLFFQTIKGTLLFGFVLGCLPYTVLRALLVQRQMQTQVEFLPAIELFYQCYLVNGGVQVRAALQRTVDERRLLGPMKAVFEQLYRNLSVRGDDEASLRIFVASLGHTWADYFANILRVALAEGVPMADGLKDLLTDMRNARRANEQERNRLLEIRIANFTPVLFLALFIGINMHYNEQNAYYYYVLDAKGRDMLLNALLLIFGSFLMGLWLSRKKM
ncbi:hypothetical protein BBD42_15075 [Paenibacillus sp. BIHB 4019]|uniref:Type II secretion system protein GspF domain-containing protein n=1 Tax=Paenibacillus sp. BIHB 4019 TaxID=1870819 RepID=A0A1B2DJ07_9BACL|nr:type II secretion system F family protein [Paenibacillus sp. BIHB 4019]ANY67655.1 hypothetical protein BBD42_15075 [Paenibacillus sp. BIHB 4019]